MKIPEPLIPLMDQGTIQDVVRPLQSGKEAQVFLVVAHDQLCVAKVYKDADVRSFKHRAGYIEGRLVRNSRQQRAMDKRSRYGREEIEAAWRSAEVDAIYRLRAAGVRVPEPYAFVDGVLVMELVRGPDGEPAPRLADLVPSRGDAVRLCGQILREVVRMLLAGLIHGDLSDFNVLVDGEDQPVIIDLPQVVDAARNQGARKILVRDVDNIVRSLGRFAPELRGRRYGQEIWGHYERNELTPDTPLTGKARESTRKADTNAILDEIAAAAREEARRRGIVAAPPPDRRALAAARQTPPKPKPAHQAPRPAEPRPAHQAPRPPKPRAAPRPAEPAVTVRRRGPKPAEMSDDLDAMLTED